MRKTGRICHFGCALNNSRKKERADEFFHGIRHQPATKSCVAYATDALATVLSLAVPVFEIASGSEIGPLGRVPTLFAFRLRICIAPVWVRVADPNLGRRNRDAQGRSYNFNAARVLKNQQPDHADNNAQYQCAKRPHASNPNVQPTVLNKF
jgi:hypothetical protein